MRRATGRELMDDPVESMSELEENLRDLYRDLQSGEISGVRSVAELAVE